MFSLFYLINGTARQVVWRAVVTEVVMSAIPIEEIYFPTRLILYNRRLELIEGDTANYPQFKRTRCSSGSDAVKLIMKLDDNCYPDYDPVDY